MVKCTIWSGRFTIRKYKHQIIGVFLQTAVKKWFREKDSGLLDNSGGPDIMVRKEDLVDCQFLKVGAIVEFECHPDKEGLIAKKVKLFKQKKTNGQNNGNRKIKKFPFGVMT
jgi:cold shock CspA family protein